MTLEEARALLKASRGRGRPAAELAIKLRQARRIIANSPVLLSPKRVNLKRRRNPTTVLPKKRKKTPPKEKPNVASKVNTKRGRPPGSKDKGKRKTKVTKKTKKKNKYIEFPLAEYYAGGGAPKLGRYTAGLDDKTLRKEAGLTVKAAKVIVAAGKGKGRPSAATAAKWLVAQEIVQRSSRVRGKRKGVTTLRRSGGRKSRIVGSRAMVRKFLVDKFKLKRRRKRGGGRRRKREKASKILPKKLKR